MSPLDLYFTPSPAYSRESVEQIVHRLSSDELHRGMQTFAINGIRNGVCFDSCFVAMMYGKVGELERWATVQNTHPLIPASDIFRHLTTDDLRILSTAHFRHAQMVYEIVQAELTNRAIESVIAPVSTDELVAV